MDSRTRQNSWYKILFVFFNLRLIVKKYCTDYKEKIKKDILSFADQKKLCTIKDFLAPFTQATFTAEKDFTFINFIFFIINVLIKHL